MKSVVNHRPKVLDLRKKKEEAAKPKRVITHRERVFEVPKLKPKTVIKQEIIRPPTEKLTVKGVARPITGQVNINKLAQVPVTKPKTVKRALLMGLNYANSMHELQGCFNDIKNVKSWLAQHDYDEIIMLYDPNRDTMIENMRGVVEKTQPGDTLFIHYSGHGNYTSDSDVAEVIVPVDNQFISDEELNDILIRGLRPGAKLRMILDCCYSGVGLDLTYRFSELGKVIKESEFVTKDIVLLSGCKNDKNADVWISKQFTGALTYAFLKAHDELANKKMFTWKDLIHRIRIILSRENYEQIAQISSTNPRLIRLPANF